MEYKFDQEKLAGDHYLMSSGLITASSILEALSDAGVFDTKRKGSGLIQFTDSCDDFYSLSLNADQLMALSEEIRDLAHRLNCATSNNEL